jgi:hypothetical protein
MKELLKDFVEPSQTAEARRQCNFSHRHMRFVEEVFGEQDPPGLCNGNWRSSEVLEKQSP